MEDPGDLSDLCIQGSVLGRNEGLSAVREGLLWLVMDFDEQAVRSYCDGGERERQNFCACRYRGSDRRGSASGDVF